MTEFITISPKAQDMTGLTFERLTVLGPIRTHNRHIIWLCRCVCGNEVEVSGNHLRSGQTKSCGCLKTETQQPIEIVEEKDRMNELVAQNTDLAHDIGITDEVSWTPGTDMDFDKYQSIGRTFQQIQRSLAYWVGDWLCYGENRFGEAYAQALEDTGKANETLIKWQAVARRVPKSIRQKDLTWTHHFYVAYIDEDQRGDMLQMALNMGLSSRELKDCAALDYDQRYDLMVAASEGIDKESFLKLVNKFKLGDIDKPKKEKKEKDDEEEEEELPFSDLGEDDEEPADNMRVGLDDDTVTDFWENCEAPLLFLGPREAIWQGICVRVGVDKLGNPRLIWEAVS